MVDAKCWLEWRPTPQQSIHSYRFESCPDCNKQQWRDRCSQVGARPTLIKGPIAHSVRATDS